MSQQNVPRLMTLFCIDDIELLNEWEKHLLPLRRNGQFTYWSIKYLQAGESKDQLLAHVEHDDCIIIFLTSRFYQTMMTGENTLMERVLQRNRDGTARAILLIVRPFAWEEDASIRELPYLPANKIPIKSWQDKEEGWCSCVHDLRELLASMFPQTPLPQKRVQLLAAVHLLQRKVKGFSLWLYCLLFFCLCVALLLVVKTVGASSQGAPSDNLQPQQILHRFCDDLQKGEYPDAYALIAPLTQKNNGGFEGIIRGWSAENITKCTDGTVQRVANTNVFTGIITYITPEVDPNVPDQTQFWIEKVQGVWKITRWGSV